MAEMSPDRSAGANTFFDTVVLLDVESADGSVFNPALWVRRSGGYPKVKRMHESCVLRARRTPSAYRPRKCFGASSRLASADSTRVITR